MTAIRCCSCLFGIGILTSALFGCSAKPRSFTVKQALDASSADGGYPTQTHDPMLDGSLPGKEFDAALDADAPTQVVSVDAGVSSNSPTEAGANVPLDAGSGVLDAALSTVERDAAAAVTEPEPTSEPTSVEPTVGDEDASAPPVVAECEQASDCDDGNLCNGGEGCSAGHCVSGKNASDGLYCALEGDDAELLCSLGSCTASECGDGFLDERTGEACDDGNDVAGDGCEANCTFTCAQDDDCSDGEPCNGAEACNLEHHTCESTEALPDQTPCGEAAECNSKRCLPADCGDGILSSAEQCDDTNLDDGDGCDADCTYSCNEDVDCDDGSVCNGTESCNTEEHVCVAGQAITCDDGSACTQNLCDGVTGCYYRKIDSDGDGQAATALGECGTDCDDHDDTVYVGAGELCDGKDNDCNGKVDETATTWYVDCDGDGFAPAKAESIQTCDKPGPPTSCDAGQVATWTATPPSGRAIDCWDKDASVNPNTAAYQIDPITGRAKDVDYDYNCDGREELKAYTENAARLACNDGIIVDPLPIDPPILAPAAAALCLGAAGWARSGPGECGQPGAWSVCRRIDGVCSRRAIERTQDCR